MLSLNQIEQHYPKNQQAFKRGVLREYLQYKILEIIYTSKYARDLVFLGGTALRIIHGNNRFSEDLDFDNLKLTTEEFSDLAEIVKKGLQLQGYEVEIKNVLKGAFHSYIRFPQVLFANKMSVMPEEKILIQIDTVPQDFAYQPEKLLLNKFDVFTEIFVTPLDILLSQKIYASVNRKRIQGRDFFDIIFLLPQTKPHYGYLKAKMNIKDASDLKSTLLDQTINFDFKTLAEDVRPFLINPDDVKKVALFREYIKQVDL